MSIQMDFHKVDQENPIDQSLSLPEQLNVTILRLSRAMVSPMAGFLPFLGALSFTWNLPNPDIIRSSPDASVDFMVSRRTSNTGLASAGDKSQRSDIF